MSAHTPQNIQESKHACATVDEDRKVEATYHTTEKSNDYASIGNTRSKTKFYKPAELRTPYLIIFCAVVLAIGTLLQITAAAYRGNISLQGLISRSVEVRQVLTSDVPVPTQELGGIVQSTNTFMLPDATFIQDTEDPVQTTEAFVTDVQIPTQGIEDPTQSSEDFIFPGPTSPPTAPPPGSYTSSNGLGTRKYFIGAYLPTLVAILLSIWWKCIFHRIKEMEPFYQMARPGGAKAEDSLLLRYHGATLPGVFFSKFNADCSMTLLMRPKYAWAVGAMLFTVVLLTGWVIMYTRRRSTGLQTDPTSIAGSAALIDKQLVRDLDYSRRYTLARSCDNEQVSIVSLSSAPHRPNVSHHHQHSTRTGSKHGHFSMHPALLAAFWLAQVGILTMLFYYRLVSKPGTGNKFEDSMNGDKMGVRTFMTALGLGVKFYWGWIEGYMRTVRPYFALASAHGSTAAQSVLLRSPSHSVTALLQADTWRYPRLAIVTIMSILSEALVVMLNGVPFTPSMLRVAFNISVYASVGILSAMIGTLTAVIVWALVKRTRRSLPGAPECIAHVIDLLGDAEGRRAIAKLVDEGQRGTTVYEQKIRFALQDVVSSEPGGSGWRIVKLPGVQTNASELDHFMI